MLKNEPNEPNILLGKGTSGIVYSINLYRRINKHCVGKAKMLEHVEMPTNWK